MTSSRKDGTLLCRGQDHPLSQARPGFERLMRDTSVKEGEKVVPLSREELNAIRARHRDHVRYE